MTIPLVPSWEDYFMTMAYLAAMRSKDQSTHIGAVIVGPDKEIRTTGYNGFVRGFNDNCPEKQERPEKYFWLEHAERNAILNIGLSGGASLKGCTMYTNGIPCMDCARAIAQVGIKKVVVDKNWDKTSADKWQENAKRTIELFKYIGIELSFWDGELINIVKYQRGKIID